MLSSEVGAVQPTAVTSRSQPTLAPSVNSTARTPPCPLTARTSPPRRASSTRATSTPARLRSAIAVSPSALAVSTTARSPGRTAYRLMSRRTPVDSMTPGRSLPWITYGRSISPGATTRAFALALTSRSRCWPGGALCTPGTPRTPVARNPPPMMLRSSTAIQLPSYRPSTTASVSTSMPGSASTWPARSARAARSASPPQRRCPPSRCSSSTSRTEAPARAAATADAIPAGPPPATRTSGWTCRFSGRACGVSGETDPPFTNRRSTLS